MTIVFLAEKWNFFEASCCRVEVISGGGGVRWGLLILNEVIVNSTPLLNICFISLSSFSLLIRRLVLSICHRLALKFSFSLVVNSASAVQYGVDTNVAISFSRSQISRSATLCTRPAERPLLMIA